MISSRRFAVSHSTRVSKFCWAKYLFLKLYYRKVWSEIRTEMQSGKYLCANEKRFGYDFDAISISPRKTPIRFCEIVSAIVDLQFNKTLREILNTFSRFRNEILVGTWKKPFVDDSHYLHQVTLIVTSPFSPYMRENACF